MRIDPALTKTGLHAIATKSTARVPHKQKNEKMNKIKNKKETSAQRRARRDGVNNTKEQNSATKPDHVKSNKRGGDGTGKPGGAPPADKAKQQPPPKQATGAVNPVNPAGSRHRGPHVDSSGALRSGDATSKHARSDAATPNGAAGTDKVVHSFACVCT